MDVITLSRLQFAVACYFHFLFVPLTLGLSVLVAIMETQFVRTGDPQYKRMTKFWGKLFVINFALGVVTGITLEFQFGTNWSRYSEVRRRHIRLSPCNRSHRRIFPRIHIHRSVVVRVEEALSQGPCGLHLAGGWSIKHFSILDLGRKLVDAAPRGLRDPKRQGRTR